MQDLDTEDSVQNINDDITGNSADVNAQSTDDSSEANELQSFLKLKEHGQSSRTRALRLKEDDVVVAIDGIIYHETIDNMVDLLSSGEESDKWLLTIWRNGKFFEIFTRGPLGGIFEFTRPEESQMIADLFKKRELGEKEDYRIYEVGISYYGRTYKEGKKIGWKDGFQAIWCILKYNIFR